MKTVEIIFSPTGGTEKVASIFSHSWSSHPTVIDLTDPRKDFSLTSINKEDMVLIAMPSFGGRAPAVAIERLRKIKGNGAKCTLVAVYGNRAYEDTLVEMEDAAKECGFSIVAAISSVAEHSIIHEYAAGRPDEDDKKELYPLQRESFPRKMGAPPFLVTVHIKKAEPALYQSLPKSVQSAPFVPNSVLWRQ
ncbi:MAG: hypothetical protein MSA93_05240 [Spirochaetales bacterium]|nr:hypothetical protein [Spirochaetales bacterium]